MTKCDLYICNDNPEMFEKAIYTDNEGKEFKLGIECNIGNWQDSVIVFGFIENEYTDEDFVRYYPHGYHNQEGNKIKIYAYSVDELIIHNNTGEILLIGSERKIDVGRIAIIEKRTREKKLKVNKIQCNHCGDIIESTSRHDYKQCSCGAVGVDGGLDYIRRDYKNEREDFIELSEYYEEKEQSN